ncbi:MAG: transposase [Bacteroidota bacterium]|nr:transposase [Bacteroidota bacterium]
MATTFRPYQPDQYFLMPPSIRDWLPQDHLAYFICKVVDQLNLEKFYARYVGDGRRNSPDNPTMMVRILIYGYAPGVISSREIARSLETDVAFRVLAANNTPSHQTICRFRKENFEWLQDLFMQVVRVAQKAGLVNMGKLSIDGTKVWANASKRKVMSYEYMEREEKRLKAQSKELVAQAEQLDEAENELHGEDQRGDELPDAVVSAEQRASVVAELVQADAPTQEAASQVDGDMAPVPQKEESAVPHAESAALAVDSAPIEAQVAPALKAKGNSVQPMAVSETARPPQSAALPRESAALEAEAAPTETSASDNGEAPQMNATPETPDAQRDSPDAVPAQETPRVAIPEGSTVTDEIVRHQKKLQTTTESKAALEARQEEVDRARERTPASVRNPKGGQPSLLQNYGTEHCPTHKRAGMRYREISQWQPQ